MLIYVVEIEISKKVCLDPSDTVLDGNPAPPSQKGGTAPNFRPMFVVAKRLD